MPDESVPQLDGCAFCDRESTKETLLYDGRDFYIIADFAPVADAHLLLIPRDHYAHLASLPPELDEEFQELKTRLGEFVSRHYGCLTYWENGVFGQSVPHAHLHAISLTLDTSLFAHQGTPFHGLSSLRAQKQTPHDHYFLVEHDGVGRVMPPDPAIYGPILRHARERNGGIWQYSPPDRRLHGRPLVEAVMQRWREEVQLRSGS